MVAGRPTKYKPEYIDKVDEYLAVNQDEEYDYIKSESSSSKGESLTREKRIRVKLPTVEGFAMFLGVNKSSLYEWRDRFPKFSDALDKIREEQRKRLLEKGLSGDYNSTIAKLILSSNHGYADKKETDITSGGKPILNAITFIDNDEEESKSEGE